MIDDIELKMLKAIESMDARLMNIRAGRANPAMLNGICAEYYGTPTPIQSLANITVPEARILQIQPRLRLPYLAGHGQISYYQSGRQGLRHNSPNKQLSL